MENKMPCTSHDGTGGSMSDNDKLCKCGHFKEEHDMVYEEDGEAWCLASGCDCLNFEPVVPVVKELPQKKEPHFEDRIAYEDVLPNGAKPIDEFVMGNADIHLEMLSDTSLYIIAQNDKQRWHFSVYHNGKSPLRVMLYEEDKFAPPEVKPQEATIPTPVKITTKDLLEVVEKYCGNKLLYKEKQYLASAILDLIGGKK